MKVLVLGVGLVGEQVARNLKALGDEVLGTTTTPDKVERLQEFCDQVAVLHGQDAERLKELAADCDAIVVTVGPNVQRARNAEEREAEYQRTLVASCKNAAAANPRSIFTSSFSVYGDGGLGSEEITEDHPLSASSEPSTRYYRLAETHVLANQQGTVLRFPDIYGSESDLSFTQRVELGHSLMGGNVPFGPDALLYRVHCRDAAAAIVQALKQDLTGIYNVADNRTLPPSNKAVFDRLADEAGLERLNFLGQILLPARKISGEKLLATGFEFQYTDYDFK